VTTLGEPGDRSVLNRCRLYAVIGLDDINHGFGRQGSCARRAGEHPARWLADIYPGRERHERPNDCGECACAVDNTWHGLPAAAAELANGRVGGERPAVMTE
jgi:hypothetical protein